MTLCNFPKIKTDKLIKQNGCPGRLSEGTSEHVFPIPYSFCPIFYERNWKLSKLFPTYLCYVALVSVSSHELPTSTGVPKWY